MKFLRIRGSSTQVRADGSSYKQARFIEKTRKYGATISEQTISVKKPILVTGAHDSGKTRFIKRLYDDERAIYGAKIKHPAVWLGALRPLSSWTDMEALTAWFENSCKANPKKLLWSSLKAYEKAERLADYVAQTKAVVFLDDAHKLSGRKLQIARECIMAATVYVISASDEQRIPPNLRGLVLKRDPQVFRLSSDVSYDMTAPLMYMAMLFFAVKVLTGIRLRHRGPTHFVIMWMLGLFATLTLYDVHHIGAAFFYGGLTHVISDAFTVTGVPFSPLSDRRFHLFGGRIRTGNPEEYLVSGSIVIVCAIIAIATRHYADVSYAPFFFDYPAYYQDGLVDAKEWREHRFKFF